MFFRRFWTNIAAFGRANFSAHVVAVIRASSIADFQAIESTLAASNLSSVGCPHCKADDLAVTAANFEADDQTLGLAHCAAVNQSPDSSADWLAHSIADCSAFAAAVSVANGSADRG